MPIKLKRGLFEGDHPLTQSFGGNYEWYARFNLKGHNGLDYGLPVGTKLFSAISGTVTESALDRTGYGNYIKVENDECGILYGHLRELSSLKVGSNVKAGDLIGFSGNTGNSTGPHLHFGVFPKPRNRNNGYAGYIDPFDRKLIEWVDVYESGASTDTLAELRKALQEMTANKDDWKQKARDFESEVKDLKKQLSGKEKQYNSLKLLCEEIENQRNDLVIELDKLNKQLLDIQDKFKTALELNVGLQKTISRLESKQPDYTMREVLILLKKATLNELKKYIKH